MYRSSHNSVKHVSYNTQNHKTHLRFRFKIHHAEHNLKNSALFLTKQSHTEIDTRKKKQHSQEINNIYIFNLSGGYFAH